MALSYNAEFQTIICIMKMTFRTYLIVIIAVLFIVNSCNKINYYPDKEYEDVQTLILAHRTGGISNPSFQENSLEGAINSLSKVDGIEVDLQISKDRTVWLSHDADLPDCGGISYDCFPEVYDSQIVELDSCNGNLYNYNRLEDIFSFMSENYSNSYIALDVKAWSPCAVTSSDVLGVMNVIADEVIRLTKKYKLQNHVMVESETATFLNYVKQNSSGIDCYLSAFGDFERAMLLTLEAGLSGISFKYKFGEEISSDHIKLIRKKGLKIQLWTVNSEEDLEDALSINPDFIQTENLDYFEDLN